MIRFREIYEALKFKKTLKLSDKSPYTGEKPAWRLRVHPPKKQPKLGRLKTTHQGDLTGERGPVVRHGIDAKGKVEDIRKRKNKE